jgi:hypothetical protein
MLTPEELEAHFYQEVASNQCLFTIQDDKGIPAPLNSENIRSMPFWSNQQLAEDFVANSAGYQGFTVLTVAWSDFSEKWAQGIHQDGLCIGLNWLANVDKNIDVEVADAVEHIKPQIA